MAFGLTANGFVPKQQSDIKDELIAALQASFGQNINVSPQSNFGQIIGIWSEREALVWQLAEAVYDSQFPSGAEGSSVDNILALNNLKRLKASPTKTAANNGGLYGLVMYGTPGTVIPINSIVSVLGSPSIQFTTDTAATIAAAANAVQRVLFSTPPSSGSFKLSIVDPFGVTQGPTAAIPFNATAATVQGALSVLPGYAGITVTGDFVSGFAVTFGGTSGNQPQNLLFVPSGQNSLMFGITVVNVAVTNVTVGTKALATTSATCTVNGPNFVVANSLTVIGTPISGWNSVNNDLDCITGSDTETDTAAMDRRSTQLASNANGTLESIQDKVSVLPGVTKVSGIENLGLAANQQIFFSTVPVAGSFQLRFGSFTTTSIPFTATAVTVQNAIRALPSYGTAIVKGSFSTGFTIDFQESLGGQRQSLATIQANTTGVAITPAFGLTGKSFEIIVQGGDDQQIADAIYSAKPAGIQSYGRAFNTTGNFTVGNALITGVADTSQIVNGMRVAGAGAPVGATVQSFTSNTVTMSLPATATLSASAVSFINSRSVTDSFGVSHQVDFSRPILANVYVTIALQTDLTIAQSPAFQPGSISTIQDDIVAIGALVDIGGTVIGFGTDGLIGAFNNVPGILGYELLFGLVNPPTGDDNIDLEPGALANFETFNCIVSYT